MKQVYALLIIVLITNSTFAQIIPASKYPPVELKGTQHIEFKSAINNRNYTIDIQLPASYKDSSTKRYTVLYVLDGQWSFPGISTMTGGLLYDNIVPKMIVAGIGWPDNYETSRTYDFSPTQTKSDVPTGGAQAFLNILTNEVKTFIDSSYRTDKQNSILNGGSFGGLFALYTLFNEPALFNGYIVCCPYLSYDNDIILNMKKHSQKITLLYL